MYCRICDINMDTMYEVLVAMDKAYKFKECDDPTAQRFLWWMEEYPDVAVCAECLENDMNRGLFFLGLLDDEVKKKEYIEWYNKCEEYEREHPDEF